ncbi:NADH:flavin oxidoreductase [Sinimarinibacterium sp. CAU 1509]|uniref:NADH:flavin oxidoreductase n=1 Tax=Sinimarinibacterium sp. CAU 1509 TaxID=2562283 RepID=UPI0010AC4C77|nr:NADH:flavin oxidoreductase [Sinimarinibacterium sp. CAU 1509]TJY58806.1 NADH:flavin oxidoreductase [Sinimarinibacterium sp. CAU 1509]
MTLPTDAARAYTPITLGPLTLRNRFIKSATNEGMAKGGVPSKLLVEHHRRMAAGGAAMTTVAYCAISPDGRTFEDQVSLDEPSLPHLRALTDAVHREGAAACAQITHGGAFTFLPQLSTRYPLSASGGFNAAGVISGRLFKTEMTTADLARVADEFVVGARRAQAAGFDAVEIHMGHGYLLSQFVSPKYNRRRDAYGGSAAQRARYPAEVLSRVLDAVGRELAVTCKICVTEGFKGGATADDAIEVARVLEAAGAHLLVLSGGMNVESPWAIFGSNMPAAAVDVIENPVIKLATRMMRLWEPKIPFRELYFLEHSRRLRAAVKMPLAYLGGAKSVAGVEQAMHDGFDCVVMGRALIHDPQLINKFRDGVLTESGCTACNECVALMYTPGGTRCVLQTADDPGFDPALNRQPAAG